MNSGPATTPARGFHYILWQEHCAILSNVDRDVILPTGNGLILCDDERFHLSLLNERIWAQDNFWYLAFLPKFPSLARDPLFEPLGTPFAHLPIMAREDGFFSMKPAVADLWIQLEFYLIRTYNVLKERFLPLAPMQTVLPPYPQSSNFHRTHHSDEEARRAAHRARRLFLGWLCLVAACIAASANSKEVNPPAWYRAIAEADPPLPPYWLDKISSSPILTEFSVKCPRRGLVVNMCTEWSFLHMLDLFQVPNLPIWLCFPHGVKMNYYLGKQLKPSKESIDRAKEAHDRGVVEIDVIQYEKLRTITSPPKSFKSPPQLQDQHINTECAEVGGDLTSPQSPVEESDPEHSHGINSGRQIDKPIGRGVDALTYFFRLRKENNDKRNMSQYSSHDLRRMRDRSQTLHTESSVFVWEELPFYPWFERLEVARCERGEVWSAHTPSQRVYDAFEDVWDCAQDFAPMQDITCNIPGCRDQYDDHEYDEGLVDSIPPHLPSHLRSAITYHQSITADEGEWFALSFSRRQMDDFLDVLKYRYGLLLPSRIAPSEDRTSGIASPKLLEALRGMVQEEALKEPQWQDHRVISAVEQFFTIIKAHNVVPTHISDCHTPNDKFNETHNSWGLTIKRLRSSDVRGPRYILHTLTSRSQGWNIALDHQTAVREVLRRGWGPGNSQISRGLLERGMPFSMLWSTRLLSLQTSSYLVTPIYRPESYEFNNWDYRSYVERRMNLFLDKAIATAALRYGGIVWRLAMESNVDIDSVGALTTADFALPMVTYSGGDSTQFESVLTPEVIDTIVGVYKVYTGMKICRD